MGIIKTETFVNEEGVERRIDTYENGMTIEYDATPSEPEAPQPSQLDRIEEAVNKSHEEIKNEAIDEYTSMLMEEGVL